MAKGKSIALLALGRMRPRGEPADEVDDEEAEGDEEGLQNAMQDFLDAQKSEDATAMAAAFRDAVELVRG